MTMNSWTDLGLCNGATGVVLDFIYADNQQPPVLTIAVIVQFHDYTGPSVSINNPGCVPICSKYYNNCQHIRWSPTTTHNLCGSFCEHYKTCERVKYIL